MRTWSIKTAQIPCWASYRAPEGCHRYFMQRSGQITSANFAKGPDLGVHADNGLNSAMPLMNQDLKTCFRRERGMCCMEFQVCTQYAGSDLGVTTTIKNAAVIADDALENGIGSVISEGWSFHIDLLSGVDGTNVANNDLAFVDIQCTVDYVEIPDSNVGEKVFGASAGGATSRYCGARMGMVEPSLGGATITHAPVYDCTEPWEMTFHSDFLTDNLVNTIASGDNRVIDVERGVCLDFAQQAC